MTETQEHGARSSSPRMSRRQWPRSTIYLTVTTAVPDFPGKVEAIDIAVSVEYAKAVIPQLSTAVIAAPERAAMISFTPLRPRLRA
jgi:hypothetical protein